MNGKRRGQLAWALAGLAGSTLVYSVDSRIPTEVAVSPLYMFPVALVAWRAGRQWALALAVVAGAQWIGAELQAGVHYSSAWIYVWNTLMRLGTFGAVAVLVARVREAHDTYRNLARHDSLTGVLNTRTFQVGLTAEIERARRYRRSLTLAYVDIDDFKMLNDRLGHVAGDSALAEVAVILSAHTRHNDLVARVGGDEFAVLLTDVPPGGVPETLSRLQGALSGVTATHGWRTTFSIGAVTFREPPASAPAALHAADELMYAVKRAGKNSVRHETK